MTRHENVQGTSDLSNIANLGLYYIGKLRVMKTFLLSKVKRYPLCAKSVKNSGGLELFLLLK